MYCDNKELLSDMKILNSQLVVGYFKISTDIKQKARETQMSKACPQSEAVVTSIQCTVL